MNRLGDSPAGWAGVAGLRSIHIEFVGNTVLAGVSTFVDEAVVTNAPEQFLHALGVALFGGADEVVVGNAHPLPKIAKLGGDFVGILQRSFAGRLRGTLDFLAVLVGAGEKECVRAEYALSAGNRVSRDGGVGVANVRPRVDIVDRGCDVELPRHKSVLNTGLKYDVH